MTSPFVGSAAASGNILPMSVIKFDTANDGRVLQAGAGDVPCGIAEAWTRNPPYPGLDDGFNAIAGEDVTYFMPGYNHGCKAQIDVNAGTITPGTLLKPASTGYLTPVTADKDVYIAKARYNVPSGGGITEVDVIFGEASL